MAPCNLMGPVTWTWWEPSLAGTCHLIGPVTSFMGSVTSWDFTDINTAASNKSCSFVFNPYGPFYPLDRPQQIWCHDGIIVYNNVMTPPRHRDDTTVAPLRHHHDTITTQQWQHSDITLVPWWTEDDTSAWQVATRRHHHDTILTIRWNRSTTTMTSHWQHSDTTRHHYDDSTIKSQRHQRDTPNEDMTDDITTRTWWNHWDTTTIKRWKHDETATPLPTTIPRGQNNRTITTPR